jgi:tetratricopeptide (TPR) repeat protein
MISFKTKGYCALATLLVLNASGCSTMSNQAEKTRLLGVPTAAIETNTDILNLEAAVRKSTKDPVAWSNLAKAYFDHQKYDLAVQAGNASLQLQPENTDIRNIIFVSGLRIASASLDGIRKDQPLSGSNLADAQTLVGTIRQSLGETSLTGTNVSETPLEKNPQK